MSVQSLSRALAGQLKLKAGGIWFAVLFIYTLSILLLTMLGMPMAVIFMLPFYVLTPGYAFCSLLLRGLSRHVSAMLSLIATPAIIFSLTYLIDNAGLSGLGTTTVILLGFSSITFFYKLVQSTIGQKSN